MVTDFGRCVTGFLTSHLVGERGMSPRTVGSYATTIRMFVRHLESSRGTAPERLTLGDFTASAVTGFLDECERSGCCPSTRNQRLAALKSLARYALREEPSFMLEGQRILAIRSKRSPAHEVEYLSREAMEAVLSAPDPTTRSGRRDMAVMSMLYDTGARVQELIDLTLADTRLSNPASATLHGKGRKMRTVPIMDATARVVERHLLDRSLPQDGSASKARLFCSPGRSSYTRPGIAKMLDRNLVRAKERHPGLPFPESIHPHMFRASKAIHLLDEGVSIIVIRDLLGHASVSTTQVYLRVSMHAKSAAIAAVTESLNVPSSPDWRSDSELMEFLGRMCT